MSAFAFALGDRVLLAQSDEEGIVTGRAEYATAEPSYYVRYKAADGRQVECWWSESALKAG